MDDSAHASARSPRVIIGESVRVTGAPDGLVVRRADVSPTVESSGVPSGTPAGPPRRRSSLLDVRFNFVAPTADEPQPPAPTPIPPASSPVAPAADADRDQAEFLSVDAFVPPAGERRVSRPSGGTFVTETMAELYLRQGLPERALEILRLLAERAPDDARLRARIAELERPAPEPAADAMLAQVSFAGFALPTPVVATGADERGSARDVLRALARRRPARTPADRTPPGVPVPTASPDDLAAAIAALSTAPLPLGGAHDDAFDDWLRGSP